MAGVSHAVSAVRVSVVLPFVISYDDCPAAKDVHHSVKA